MTEDFALLVAQVVISGLLVGLLYSLMACGLNLVFGVMGIINMAHGELLMLGAFLTYWLFTWHILGAIPSLLFSMPLLFFVGLGIQKYLLERVARGSELSSLLLTYGLSVFVVNSGLFLWSSNFRSVPYFSGSVKLAGLAFPQARLAAGAMAIIITAAVFAFLRMNRVGKAIRATAQNAASARACGINVRRMRLLVFGLGAAMAGAAGSLMSTMYAFNPDVGQLFILKTFAIVILGGLGNFVGAFFGALILGVGEALAAFVMTARLSEAVSYLILILVLLIRPTGLLGFKE